MGRKGNAKCTEIKNKIPTTYTYEVIFSVGDATQKICIDATHIAQEDDDLVIYAWRDGEEIQVGGIRNWICFSVLPPEMQNPG